MQDYTKVRSVFKKKLKTISIRLDDRYTTSPDDPSSIYIRSVEDAYQVASEIFKKLDDSQEHFIILCLLGNGRVQGFKHISSGGQSSAIVDCAIILRSALLLGSRSIVAIHNHPSGSLSLSQEDKSITKVIADAGELTGIRLLDHIIYTHHGFVSLRERYPEFFHDDIRDTSIYCPE